MLEGRGTQAHFITGLSADSENSYSLSCGVPSLQGKTLQKRNSTSSGAGPSCSGSPWPVHAARTWTTLDFASSTMLGGERGVCPGKSFLPGACAAWPIVLGREEQGWDLEASRLQAESKLRGSGPWKGPSGSEARGHGSRRFSDLKAL